MFVLFSACVCFADDFNFPKITKLDIEQVRQEWQGRDLSSQQVKVVDRSELFGHKVLIVKHLVLGSVHYGAILLPNNGKFEKDTPVLVIADGLDQSDKTFSFAQSPTSRFFKAQVYKDFIKVIPAYRGRTLVFADNRYQAEGDFCDAYDGATDDAIALLNVAQEVVPEGRYDKVLAIGGSRGGTVVLLMGVRDPRIHTVIASSAPVDFYRTELKDYYGDQFACQFLTDKTIQETKLRILASSPLHFTPTKQLTQAIIQHGQKDKVVPLWNAREISNHLVDSGIYVSTFIYAEKNHLDAWTSPSHKPKNYLGIEVFRRALMYGD